MTFDHTDRIPISFGFSDVNINSTLIIIDPYVFVFKHIMLFDV